MTKIQPKEVRYIVNREKGVVVCVIDGTQWLAEQLVQSYYNRVNYCDDDAVLKINNSFVGIARLAKGDTWDVEYGKLLAYDRAKYKLTQSIFKHVQNYVSKLEKETDELVEGVNRYFDKVTHNKNFREQRLGAKDINAES